MTWIQILPVSLSFLAVMVPFAITNLSKRRNFQFDAFHRLIKEFVQPDPVTWATYIDRQMAAVYELRRFTHYYPVTLRILKPLRSQWAIKPENLRLIEEVDRTIDHIEMGFFRRWFHRR